MLNTAGRSRSLRSGGRGGPGHAGFFQTHGLYAPLSGEPGHVSGPKLQTSTVLGLVDNVPAPPVSSSDGRSPYLNRPLPPPPPPKTPAVMLGRPGTSGGMRTGMGLGQRNFEHRISRDDMFLKPTYKSAFDSRRISRDDMYLGRKSSTRAAFHVPQRGQLPTPEASPRHDTSPMASMPARVASPESRMSGEIPIGMALGSPAHPPSNAGAIWSPMPMASPAKSPPAETGPRTEQPLQRSKTRRKIFGIFGSRRHAEPAKPSPEPSDLESAASTPVRAAGQGSSERLPTRSNTQLKRKPSKHQPIIIRTNTEPFAKSPLREASSPQPALRNKASEPAFGHAQRARAATQDSLQVPSSRSRSKPPRSPFLDVEIPDVKLERYSVMFGSLLNQNQQQQQHHQLPSSSLLSRRQATLDKLKTINDRIVQEEEAKGATTREQQITSPLPTKSPGFSLFPPTPSVPRTVDSPPITQPLPSPRFRSNTSPALLPSPVRATFEPELVPVKKPHSKELHLTVDPLRGNPMPRNDPQGEVEKLRKPPPISFDHDRSSLILESPVDASEDESRLSRPFRPHIPESQWQMASPLTSTAPSTASSSASSTRKRSPSSVSSVHTHGTQPSVEIEEADTVLKNAVEISIARQISVSRQQRQMLRPLQSGSSIAARRRANTTTSTPPVRNQLGRNEKLQETKSSMPTLVVPQESPEKHQRMQYRKSERVVLEAA